MSCKKNVSTLSATENIIFKIENGKVEQNTFPEKMSRDL